MEHLLDHAEADPPAPGEPHRLRWNPEVSLGALLQAAVLLCGLVSWLVAANNRAEQASRDLASFHTVVSGQISDLRSALTTAIADLRGQLAALPEQQARIGAVEREARATDERVGAVERAVLELRAEFNAAHAVHRP